MSFRTNYSFLNDKKKSGNGFIDAIYYDGEYKDVKTKIEFIEYNSEKFSINEVDKVEIKNSNDAIYWYNIIGLNNPELIDELRKKLEINFLDIAEIVHVSEWSKLEIGKKYNFAVLKMIYKKDNDYMFEHLAIYQKGNLVITFQETEGDIFNGVRDRLNNSNTILRNKNADYLLYSMLDELVDNYFMVINRIVSSFKKIEMEILDSKVKERDLLYKIRKDLLYLSYSINPLKESLEAIIERGALNLSELLYYYKGLNARLKQISKSLISYEEMTNGIYEIYMSNISNNMNKSMMTLTIFSAIFIPLSFLAGVYGMNFKHMPGLNSYYSFYLFVFLCLSIVFGMLIFFKKNKWF